MKINFNRSEINSIYLLVRLIIVTISGLAFVKLFVGFFGFQTYGLFSSVISIILILTFINNILVSVTNRYVTVSLGEGDFDKFRKTFSSSFQLHFIIGLITIAVGYFYFKLWFIYSLQEFKDIFSSLSWLFVLSLLTAFFTIISAPFQSILIAHENFKVKSLIEGLNALLKVVLILIAVALNDAQMKILCYAFPLVLCIPPLLFIIYALKKYRKLIIIEKKIVFSEIKEKINFAIWITLGALSFLLKTQAVVILFLYMYGPIKSSNAAIINQVFFASWSFIQLFSISSNPGIMKLFSSKKMMLMHSLMVKTSITSLTLSIFIFNMFILFGHWFLGLWLGDIPDNLYISIFYLFIALCFEAIILPFHSAIQAYGKIKNYQIFQFLPLLIFFTSFCLFQDFVFDDSHFYFGLILVGLMNCLISFYFIKKFFNWSFYKYLTQVLKPLKLLIIFSLLQGLMKISLHQTKFDYIVFPSLLFLIILLGKFYYDIFKSNKEIAT